MKNRTPDRIIESIGVGQRYYARSRRDGPDVLQVVGFNMEQPVLETSGGIRIAANPQRLRDFGKIANYKAIGVAATQEYPYPVLIGERQHFSIPVDDDILYLLPLALQQLQLGETYHLLVNGSSRANTFDLQAQLMIKTGNTSLVFRNNEVGFDLPVPGKVLRRNPNQRGVVIYPELNDEQIKIMRELRGRMRFSIESNLKRA